VKDDSRLRLLVVDDEQSIRRLCMTVGQGMNHAVGTAARLFSALAKARVNVRMIDQGSSEQNIIVGVEEGDLALAIRAIYDEFA